MKNFLVIITLIAAIPCYGQIGIKLFQFRPIGDLGAAMKKSYSGELMYIGDFENGNLRLRAGVSFIILKPRLDTFPVYTLKQDGNGITAYPGYEVYHKYNMYLFHMGFDYKIITLGNFSFYPGLDFIVGGVDMDYNLSYETLSGENFSGGEILGGIRLRLGADYSISEKTGLFMEISRSMYKIAEQGGFSHHEIGIGFRYKF